MDRNDATELFYSKVFDKIEIFTPLACFKGKCPTWYSRVVILSIGKKERARRRWKLTFHDADYKVYAMLRSQSKLLIAQSYKNYLKHLQVTMNTNIKTFWAFTKSKRHTNSYPKELSYNDNTSSQPTEMCEMFANYFQSTYSNGSGVASTSTEAPTTNNAVTQFVISNIDPGDVKLLLSKLDENKHGGPDGIPNIFAKRTRESISLPLSILFNKSLIIGIVPEKFKKALITPIHKKGKKSEIVNYRPVCLFNALSKVFERLVHDKPQEFLLGKLDVHQHGFVEHKSTLTHLTHY